ncbi:DUF397 domain-containing protein [Spongiactinospora rosea]|uniref:DUF397 domain-containing protein n=1 Tax=Spongiactinospora rosea TaxID=2248750 RepID=A0A366LTE3_9ACTN|nr:DUF397 domain-containing protein [Spongiactinospora rosea]RBQ16584.1 DUF397 domain-containing protein [Spongiactinospora rosea]
MSDDVDLSRTHWQVSSYSGANGNCVAVAFLNGRVAIRDSKNPNSGTLTFTTTEWQTFLGKLRSGDTEAR